MNIKEGMDGAVALRRWRRDFNFTRPAAAGELGVSERMLAYYESGERSVPRAILLAVRALTAGLQATPESEALTRDRWVIMVKNVMDYGAGDPVVGRMLKERNRQGLDDFLTYIRRGPDPALALTDPALFRSLRSAVTKAQLSGLARYRMNAAMEADHGETPGDPEHSPVHM